MRNPVDIEDLDPAAVLAALWNNAAPPPFEFYRTTPMNRDEAEMWMEHKGGCFDYHQDRLLKVNLTGDVFGAWGYDRDNGEGLAQRVVDHLRATGSVARFVDGAVSA